MVPTVSSMAWLQIPRCFSLLFTRKLCHAVGHAGCDSGDTISWCAAPHPIRSGAPGSSHSFQSTAPSLHGGAAVLAEENLQEDRENPLTPSGRVSTSQLAPARKGLIRCLVAEPGCNQVPMKNC